MYRIVGRYYEFVGESRCTIVDTWWQTETGGHMATPIPGVTHMKPGAFLRTFFIFRLSDVQSDKGDSQHVCTI